MAQRTAVFQAFLLPKKDVLKWTKKNQAVWKVNSLWNVRFIQPQMIGSQLWHYYSMYPCCHSKNSSWKCSNENSGAVWLYVSSLRTWQSGIHAQAALKNLSGQNQGWLMLSRIYLFLIWFHLKKNVFLALTYNIYYSQTSMIPMKMKINIRIPTPRHGHILQTKL